MITVERHGKVSVLRMDYAKVNVIDLEFMTAIAEQFRSVPASDAIVLTGNGRAFSAGVNLKRLMEEDLGYTTELLDMLSSAILEVFLHPRPVVAAIDGHAIAGGFMLAAACDLRLMSEGMTGMTELKVGVPIPSILREIARHSLGHYTQSLVLSGDLIDAQRAYEIGFVDAVIEPEKLLDAAIARASALAAIPAATYALTKRTLKFEAVQRMEVAEPELDEEIRATWHDPEIRAGIAAYLASISRK
ncbi:MAG: enoyl-CoA hydratase/isomerase family protein [Candidatus Nanopelagicales bacterium]|nr:enoyl-CoA hydratase/isomerase family protein [Candidatus Nanopelagicales bacterium]